MKHNIKTIALFLGLGLVAASCQKENIVDQGVSTEETHAYISVDYTIDGVSLHASFDNEILWQEFIHQLFVLAEEGHRISFGNSNRVSGLTKETVTYTTQSQSAAEAWGAKMAKDGYLVFIDFDEKTKTYTCTAIK